MAFNLVRDAWMPVIDGTGRREFIRPAQVVERAGRDAWLSFDAGRPELDMACLEFLIGLLSVACPPQGAAGFAAWFKTPPSVTELDEAFSEIETAFDLDAPSHAFMQDPFPDQLEDSIPVHELLLVSGSNEMHFTPASLTAGQERPVRFGRQAMAVVLFAHQITAPSGGRGHRTSPRGGGPLTAILVPYEGRDGEPAIPASLWHRAWVNVPSEEGSGSGDRDLSWFFPWMSPPGKIDFKRQVVPGDGVDPLQVMWPMPRRVVVEWLPNTERLPCDLTGIVDDVIAISFRRVHGGLDYPSNVWVHPFTPRYRSNDPPPTLPVRPRAGHDTLGDWVTLVYGRSDGTTTAAPIVSEWLSARRDVVPDVRLHACGFATESAKVVDWIDRTLPVIGGGDHARGRSLVSLAEAMVDTCDAMGKALRDAVKGSTYSERNEGASKSITLAALPVRLTRDVRPLFYESLAKLMDEPARDEALREAWLGSLGVAAQMILDDIRPLQDAPAKDVATWLKHRRFLGAMCRGTSPQGAAQWKRMGLVPPKKQTKGKPKAGKVVQEERRP